MTRALLRPRRPRRALAWGLVAALALVPLLAPAPATTRSSSSLARLFGPFADLAADLAWIGFQRARLAGRDELAITRAELALALAPGETRGWELLAEHLGLDLASPEREPDPSRRLAWLQAGLATARRGEAHAREPADLALVAAILLLTHATQDPGLPWPGGRPELWRATAAAGERATTLGHPDGRDLAAYARELAAAEPR